LEPQFEHNFSQHHLEHHFAHKHLEPQMDPHFSHKQMEPHFDHCQNHHLEPHFDHRQNHHLEPHFDQRRNHYLEPHFDLSAADLHFHRRNTLRTVDLLHYHNTLRNDQTYHTLCTYASLLQVQLLRCEVIFDSSSVYLLLSSELEHKA
jgi:hypothetical protein